MKLAGIVAVATWTVVGICACATPDSTSGGQATPPNSVVSVPQGGSAPASSTPRELDNERWRRIETLQENARDALERGQRQRAITDAREARRLIGETHKDHDTWIRVDRIRDIENLLESLHCDFGEKIAHQRHNDLAVDDEVVKRATTAFEGAVAAEKRGDLEHAIRLAVQAHGELAAEPEALDTDERREFVAGVEDFLDRLGHDYGPRLEEARRRRREQLAAEKAAHPMPAVATPPTPPVQPAPRPAPLTGRELEQRRVEQERDLDRLLADAPDGGPAVRAEQLRVAALCEEQSDFVRAQTHLQHVVDWYADQQLDDADLRALRERLLASAIRSGDLLTAIALEEQMLEALAASVPPSHPQVLASKETLARHKLTVGDVAGAMRLLDEVLAAHESSPAADARDIERIQVARADAYRASGDLANAAAVEARILGAASAGGNESAEQRAGRHSARRRLIATRLAAHDLGGARALAQQQFDELSAAQPSDPAAIRDAGDVLAAILRAQRDFAAASEIEQETLRRAAGTQPGSRSMLFIHARTLLRLRRFEEALALFEQAAAGLDPSDPSALVAASGKAEAWIGLGRLAEARSVLERAIDAAVALPADHAAMLTARELLVRVLEALGDERDLEAMRRALAESSVLRLPEDHPRKIAIRERMAADRQRECKFDEALAIRRTMVETLRVSRPEGSADLVEASHQLVALLRVMGRLPEARVLERRIAAEPPTPSATRDEPRDDGEAPGALDDWSAGPQVDIVSHPDVAFAWGASTDDAAPRNDVARVSEPLFSFRARIHDPAGIHSALVLQDGFLAPAKLAVEPDGMSASVTLDVRFPSEMASVLLCVAATNARGITSPPRSILFKYEPPQRKLFVVALGVGNYRDRSLRLENPGRDVEDLVSALKEQRGDYYADVDARALVDEDVTITNLRLLRRNFLQDAREHDTVLVYATGHGLRNERGEYFLLTVDATTRNYEGALERRDIEDLVRFDRHLPRQRVLCIDTCNSGPSREQGELGADEPVAVVAATYRKDTEDVAKRPPNRGLYVLAAAPRFGKAYDGGGRNGLFAEALLAALDGASDANGDRMITIDELRSFTVRDVDTRSRLQQQVVAPTTVDGSNFVFAKVRRRR